jgi:betaine-homocysteine S-methyltransferase
MRRDGEAPAHRKSRRARRALAEGPIICAEGYLFELERRGYVQAGAFVPGSGARSSRSRRAGAPRLRARGSDVVEAFTYYAHREKLRIIGREHQLER